MRRHMLLSINGKNKKKLKKTGETALNAYFQQLSINKKPNSLWAYHSMLKTMIRIRENIDIGKYQQLNYFLKKKLKGYKPVKVKVFVEREMEQFIFEANDHAWLDVKIVFIFGLCGALRCCEFMKITFDDVDDHGRLYLVQVRDPKNMEDRSFTITGHFHGIVKKYVDLRPINAPKERFFLNYQKGKCTSQPIGKHKIGKMPYQVAVHLNLQNPGEYTGHSLRRTSATFLANSGACMEMVQRIGGWKSTKVAQGYIDSSIEYKRRTGNTVLAAVRGTTAPFASTSTGSPFPSTSTSSTFPSTSTASRIPSTSLPSTSLDSASKDEASVDSFDFNCVASQGYAITADDTIEDSVIATLNEGEMGNSFVDNNRLSFSNCTVTINFKK